MNKVFFSVMACAAFASVAFAQTPPATNSTMNPAPGAPATTTQSAPVATSGTMMAPTTEKILSGAVKSVSSADAAKGTKSEIVVDNASGKSTEVLVKATSTLYDADGKAITLDKIAVGSKVNVVYTTSAEGIDEAKSIKVVK